MNGNLNIKMGLIMVLLIFALVNAAQPYNVTISKSLKKVPKRNYVCPPNFIRLSHRCYYFSKNAETWQEAYFHCRDLHSNLAIIRNSNQDKHVRKTLKRTLTSLERWLGGLYDWEQMTWKWAASGKPLGYQGFSQMGPEDREKLRWHCIIMDPNLQYKWNTRSCLDRKHFICHTKIKIVTNKGKRKLLKQYNVNRLNEILPENMSYNISNLKEHHNFNKAEFAVKPQERRRKIRRRKKKVNVQQDSTYNVTMFTGTERRKSKNNDEVGDLSNERIKWKTYYKDFTLNPLHPKPIVEEFNYVKYA